MNRRYKMVLLAAGLYGLGTGVGSAGELAVPNAFSAGTPAVADEVNANFDAAQTAVNDNNARIAELETENADLTTRLEALESYVEQLQDHLAVDTRGNIPVVRVSGANLQVVNGQGESGTVNGAGNLIVGYDEPRPELSFSVCSLGEHDNQDNCEADNGTWAPNHKSGSHNIVVGASHVYSRHSGLVAGFGNMITGRHASVSGGALNIARGDSSSVCGGYQNETSGRWSSISGGDGNDANGQSASVLGGQNNTANGARATVGGGFNNFADATNSSVSGGQGRSAVGDEDWVGGSLLEDF